MGAMGSRLLALGLLVLTACGTDEPGGEPLIAGAMTASYNGTDFTPAFGFATLYNGGGFIAVGTGPLACGVEKSPSPPGGRNAILSVPLVVGPHSAVGVQMIENVGDFTGIGSNTGSVTIVAVSDTSVSGTVAFDYTDTQSRHFTLNGPFEVMHCAQ
jgi:hypothetical protein